MIELHGMKVEFTSFPETEKNWTLQEIESKPMESRVKTYTIKPLEWVKPERHSDDWESVFHARPKHGSWCYFLRVLKATGEVTVCGAFLLDDANYKGEFPELDIICSSVEDAKAKAQQHWESEAGIGAVLQEVSGDL